jgi:hydroxymethylglutaryl-CoA lyase
MNNYTLIECPRDAMQGMKQFIPTQTKIEYLNLLLKMGFDVLDCGSFVSAKAIPQMQDTPEVLKKLEINDTKTELLVIVANRRGAEEAVMFEQIRYLGFPFSVSEEFQKRNTNSTREESLKRVEEIQNLCIHYNKKLVIYLSMAFGNPYGEKWSPEMVVEWGIKIKSLGVDNFRLADTIGCSTPENIQKLFQLTAKELKDVVIGVHLHSRPHQTTEKIAAAWNSGCKVFDSALLGFGGCPMAKDELTGNISTEKLLDFLEQQEGLVPKWNKNILPSAIQFAQKIFL